MPISHITASIREFSEMIKDWKSKYDPSLEGVIQLTGGEPVLRNDWKDIVDYCKHQSLNVILMTNGTLLTEDIASYSSQNNIRVQVSIDGPKETHDKIRGDTSFKAALKGLCVLIHKNVDCSVSMTLMKSNMNEIDGLIEILKEVGVFKLGISRYLPKDRNDDEFLSRKDLEQFYKSINQINRQKNFDIFYRDPLFNVSLTGMKNTECSCISGCSIGFFGFCILNNGDIVPCSRLNIPLGNIQTDSLRTVWATSYLLWKFREYEVHLTGKCGVCKHSNHCRGCRAIAHAVNGDCFTTDPQCGIA